MTRFGLDLDGVVYNWQSVVGFLLNHKFGLGLDLREWTSYGWLEDNVPPKAIEWLWTDGVRMGMFRHGHVYKGSIEALREISSLADIVVVSHRPTSLKGEVDPEIKKIAIEDTMDWLAFHRIPCSEVHLLTRKEPKSTVICDSYLDDSASVIKDLTESGPAWATVMLWDRPWNQSVPSNSAVCDAEGNVEVFAPPSGPLLEPWARRQKLPIRVSAWAQVVGLLRWRG